MTLLLGVDGSSNPTTGMGGWGICVSNGDELYGGISLPDNQKCTNNIAEYIALINALNYVLSTNSSAKIVVDSMLVAYQLKGTYKVRSARITPLYKEAKALMNQLGCLVSVEWGARNSTPLLKQADKLSRNY